MKLQQLLSGTVGLLSLGLVSLTSAQDSAGIEYGLSWDAQSGRVKAMAYPNFSDDDATIVTSVFTILVPAGTQTSPAIDRLPATGRFYDNLGLWDVQRLTPRMYGEVGLEAEDMGGYDIYQATLLPGTAFWSAEESVGVELFSFSLPGGCQGEIQVLGNDTSVQQKLLKNLALNYNNEMSVSIAQGAAKDIYQQNSAADTLNCQRLRTKVQFKQYFN